MTERSLGTAVSRFNAALAALREPADAARKPGTRAAPAQVAGLIAERDAAKAALQREAALRKDAVARLDEAIGALRKVLKS